MQWLQCTPCNPVLLDEGIQRGLLETGGLFGDGERRELRVLEDITICAHMLSLLRTKAVMFLHLFCKTRHKMPIYKEQEAALLCHTQLSEHTVH